MGALSKGDVLVMRAARLQALRSLQVREMDTPSPGPRELLLRVEACGVCGTDRHIVHGEYPATLPVTLGHEFAGTVIATGPEATIAVGTRIAVDPNISCGFCRECRNGRVALCVNLRALGVNLDGGLADHTLVPDTQAYPLPAHVPATYGALCEPLACSLHGLDLADIRPGMSVVVLGGGMIGQLMVQLARLCGATTIILATRQASRRVLAERLGATATIDPAERDTVSVVTRPDGLVPGGVDVVLECAGTVETFGQSLALARRGGTVLVFGVVPQGQQISISPYDILARELRIIGAYLNPLTHARAVELVASGRLDLESLITRYLGLDDIPDVLAAPPEPGEVKTMLSLL